MSNRDEVALNATKRIIKIISAPGPANQQQAKIQVLLIDLLEKHSAPPAAAHGDEAARALAGMAGLYNTAQDELDAMRKDAERYRYLRDMTEGLDATVDAMIAEDEGGDV